MKIEEALKMEQFESEQQRALLSVVFTGNWLTDKINQQLKPFDVSEQQFNVLRILRGQQGNPLNLLNISERMLHRMSNATRLVEKLRQKGLVDRSICENNRRKVEISITTKGTQLLKQIDKMLQEHHQQLEAKLTAQEAQQLVDLVEKLRA